MHRLEILLYVLATLSLAATAIGVVFGPEWIEVLTGLEPDGGDGSLERLLVVLPGVAAVLLGLSGYALHRLARAAYRQ